MIIYTISLLLFAAFCNACMDLLQFHYHTSIWSKLKKLFKWMNPAISWRNKYQKTPTGIVTNRPAFFGSTTFLVWTTDGWHFFQMLMWTSLQAAVAINISISGTWVGYPIASIIIDIFLYKILMGSFETILLRTLKKRP